MTIDPVLASIIVAIIVNAPAYFISRETNRKLRVERELALAKAQEDAKNEASRREQLEREITEKVLASSNSGLEWQQQRIDSLQKQIDGLQAKLSERDGQLNALRRDMQEQIDKLTEMVRQLLQQLRDNGHEPAINMAEFKAIESKYR